MDVVDPRNELFNRVINLIDDVDLGDFNLGIFTKEKAEEVLAKLDTSASPEEDLFEILIEAAEEPEEQPTSFPIIDMTEMNYGLSELPENAPNIARSIGYLQDLIERFKNGEATTMTVVALLNDGRASIWLPNGLNHAKVDELFDPLIEELRESTKKTLLN